MMTRCSRRNFLAVCAAGVPSLAASEGTAALTVDCRRTVGAFRRGDQYLNTSLRRTPPPELAARVEKEYGRPRIVRCWLPLDDMWDYRTDRYNFNFQCGKDTFAGDAVKHKYDRDLTVATDIRYYDYLDAFSQHSEELLLNVRRYEYEAVHGVIPMAKWKQVFKTGVRHYAERFQNLQYIEVLNEYHLAEFGGLDDRQYYTFYRAAYEAIAELNDELGTWRPLRVGGPCATGRPLDPKDPDLPATWDNMGRRLHNFLETYSQDTNPKKQLDFVSFHDYFLGKEPARYAAYGDILDGWLKAFGLSDRMPLFETEIGIAGPKPDFRENLRQAAGISTLLYYGRKARDLRIFPWVLYHNPVQLSLVQFADGLRMTPFGAAMKMWSLHKASEVHTEWTGPASDGLFALATTDGSGLAVEVWNYSPAPVKAHVSVVGLPAAAQAPARVQRYLIDSRHSNCLANTGAACELETVPETGAAEPRSQWDLPLEPYALSLYAFQFAK